MLFLMTLNSMVEWNSNVLIAIFSLKRFSWNVLHVHQSYHNSCGLCCWYTAFKFVMFLICDALHNDGKMWHQVAGGFSQTAAFECFQIQPEAAWAVNWTQVRTSAVPLKQCKWWTISDTWNFFPKDGISSSSRMWKLSRNTFDELDCGFGFHCCITAVLK